MPVDSVNLTTRNHQNGLNTLKSEIDLNFAALPCSSQTKWNTTCKRLWLACFQI